MKENLLDASICDKQKEELFDASVESAQKEERKKFLRDVVCYLEANYSTGFMCNLVKNEETNLEFLEALAACENERVQKVICFNPNVTPEFIEKILPNASPDLLESIACSEATPVEVLEKLSHSRNYFIRAGVAKNIITPTEVLKVLAKEELKNEDLPEFIAYRGTRNSVFYQIIRNPNVNADILDIIADSNDEYVLKELAFSYVTSAETLDKLMDKAHSKELIIAIAENHNAETKTLEKLMEYDWEEVNIQIAFNSHATPEMLKKLFAVSHDEDMPYAVAQNPNTSADMLTLLSEWHAEDVREAVAQNLNTPSEVLATLAQEKSYSNVLYYVAGNPNTPYKALKKLAKCKAWHVKREVAYNPSTPYDIMKRLSHDTCDRVKSVAIQRLCVMQEP